MRAAKPKTYSTLKGSILRETEKAIHFRIDMPGDLLHDETFWFPISQMKRVKRSHSSDLDEIEIADWLIEQKSQDVANLSSKNSGFKEETHQEYDDGDEDPWQT